MSIHFQNIRNFCIIAHIDHGKSTLADRMLELTGTVSQREMRAQILDSMDLERERGITIKLTPVRMNYCLQQQCNNEAMKQFQKKGEKFIVSLSHCYILNLIDTPGHADFTYEVSRSLAAVEGAILLVDATQGVQAQTLANLHLALDQGLTIIPAINKIDLPNAESEQVSEELHELLGCQKEDILLVSAKTGQGVAEVLEAVIERIPTPKVLGVEAFQLEADEPLAQASKEPKGSIPLRALIFDSVYDTYRGVVAYVRLVDGAVAKGERIRLLATQKESEVLEVGSFTPTGYHPEKELTAGEIGYIVTGFKDIVSCRVGDTIASLNLKTSAKSGSASGGQNSKLKTIEEIAPLPGYKEVKSMVFAGFFPKTAADIERLREAVEKLKLNDASFNFEPEHLPALGFGFRCGFLGLLHLDIIRERLKREHNVEVVVTVPSVGYEIIKTNNEKIIAHGATEFPDPSVIKLIREPWARLDIITPETFVGGVIQLVQEFRGVYLNTEYLGAEKNRRAILHYELPLSRILVDFYDRLKSVSQGYASMNYEFLDYREARVRRLDILVAEVQEEALATIVYEDEAYSVGKKIVTKLKESLPQQWFVVKLQAALGGKIVAAERLSALHKDVTAKLYGGDVTRKRKLLEKQKKGKKKMAALGRGKVDIPPETFLAVLKR